MTDVGDAVADGIQHLEGRHKLARRVYGNVELPARQRPHTIRNALSRHAGTRQPLRPRRHHAPFLRLGTRDSRRG